MNVFLIGGAGSLIDNLIIKLNKEGHRVYLLTGNRYAKLPYQKVFERYNFTYDCSCLMEIFDSVNPDLTIFMGAYDTNFKWLDEELDAVKYSASLMNILMGYAMKSKGRFLYLSSEEVYSGSYPENISEAEPTKPLGLRGMALAQGEEMCESYRKNRGLDIVTLRMDHLYGIPKTRKDVVDICSKMCLEVLEKKEITIKEDCLFSLLYETDAIEFIYRVASCRTHQSSLYNISSSQVISQRELAEIVWDIMGDADNHVIFSRETDLKPMEASKRTPAGAENTEAAAAEKESVEAIAAEKKSTGPAESMAAEKESDNGKISDEGKDSVHNEMPDKENEKPFKLAESEGAERRVLSNALYDSEFGNPFFCKIPVIVKKIAAQMQKNRYIFLTGEAAKPPLKERLLKKAGWFFRAVIPFAENCVLFIPFFMLNNRAVGSEYFGKLDFYLLYVLLFAIVYGQQQATFSAVLAVAGYCFRQMYDRSGFEVMLDANTYMWIAQLFILGLVVGYMRDQIAMLKRESQEEKDYLSLQLSDVQDINSSNVRVKDALETQIVNQYDSVGKIYSITSALDQYSPEEVLFYAAEMLGKLVKSKDVAIYTVSNASYARLFSSTSKKARMLGHSIKYTQMGAMSDALANRKVFINREMNQEYPLMAHAIYDNDDMQMILMVWGIPWESMTLGQANQLVVISALIQNAVVRSNRYMSALEDQRYVEDTQTLETSAFTSLMNAYLTAKSKGLTECTVLKVKAEPEKYKEAGKLLMGKLRQTDYIGTLSDGGLYALLSNTNMQDAQFVIKRFADIGYESHIVRDGDE